MANHLENCIQCKLLDHWIEIHLVDEHGKPLKGMLRGTLKDNCGYTYDVVFHDGYLLQMGLSAGPVQIKLVTDELINSVLQYSPRTAKETNPVPSLAQKTKGYNSTAVNYQNITVGDIWSSSPKTKLTDRHQPGATGKKLILVVDHSYMLEVRAFIKLTVRLGMFFDGTSNNTFNAELAKSKIHDWAFQCSDPSQLSKLQSWCANKPVVVGSSADNEITNIQKLHDLYNEKQNISTDNVLILKQYVTGIGTTNEGSSVKITDDVSTGTGLGMGETGVDGKVKLGCQNIIKQLSVNKTKYDFITKFEFDVFGFSRGAAAARHFTNQVLKGKYSYFGESLNNNNIMIAPGFNWLDKYNCEFKFIGIYDTVAATAVLAQGDFSAGNDKNPTLDLGVSHKQVTRLVHLTAADEFRFNFALNKINPASQFSEYSVPGAHSDLGGGYISRYYLDPVHPEKMDRALYSETLVQAFSSTVIMTVSQTDIKNSTAWKKAQQVKNKLISDGWGNSEQVVVEYSIQSGVSYPIQTQVICTRVILKRIVEGDLSRIYLRAMYGFAQSAGVPLLDFLKTDSLYKVNPELDVLADIVLKKAQNNQLADELLKLNAIKRSKYFHYSSEVGTVYYGYIYPFEPANNNKRAIYPCVESKIYDEKTYEKLDVMKKMSGI